MADTMLEPSEAPRRVFERIVLRRGSLRGLGQRCGRSTMWIWRQLRQNKGVDLVKTGKVLDQLGVPIRFFYEEILDQTPEYDPAWLLEHYREGNGIPRDPFLSEVHDRLLNLVDRPSAPGGQRRRKAIEVLDEQRLFDRAVAKRGLEALGREILRDCEEQALAGNSVHRGTLADAAWILILWSAVQRTRGHRDDSVDGYRLAYRLLDRGGDPATFGIFFYFVTNLLLELGQPSHALRFAEKACSLFQQLRNRDLLAQGLIQRSVALGAVGKNDESRLQAIAALRVAPRDAWRTRSSAWNHLGNLALLQNKCLVALGKFGRARRLSKGSGFFEAFLEWRHGATLLRLGRKAEAVLAFRASIELFEHFGQPLDVAFVAVDLAEILMKMGRFAEALVIARALTPTFEKLSTNAQASALWLDLVALILQGSRDGSLAQVGALRNVLEMADSKIRQHMSA